MIRLNDIFVQEGIQPQDTAILLHSPPERRFAALLPLLAEAEPEILETYQSTHSQKATATLRGWRYMASFIRVQGGALAFAGLYRNRGDQDLPMSEIAAMPMVRRLIDEFGVLREFENPPDRAWPWFRFERTDHLAHYVGRLQIRPRLTPTYARLAERLDAEIAALSEESVLSASAPDWREFIVTGPQLRALPSSWGAKLREWRGIYLIVDESDGQRYVGSAYGADNLLGRWLAHVAGPVGVTAELRKRDPRDFRFSILERVSPDMPADDVIRLERTWMDRLHTVDFGLNS
jgi:hypothetical protein